MANKEKMGPPTLEMIQGNPYNYTFDEVAKCMGEERAKSLFKTLYKNGVSPKNQTMTIKDIYVGGVVCFKRLIHHDMSKSLKTYKATKQKGDPHEQTENNRPV